MSHKSDFDVLLGMCFLGCGDSDGDGDTGGTAGMGGAAGAAGCSWRDRQAGETGEAVRLASWKTGRSWRDWPAETGEAGETGKLERLAKLERRGEAGETGEAGTTAPVKPEVPMLGRHRLCSPTDFCVKQPGQPEGYCSLSVRPAPIARTTIGPVMLWVVVKRHSLSGVDPHPSGRRSRNRSRLRIAHAALTDGPLHWPVLPHPHCP